MPPFPPPTPQDEKRTNTILVAVIGFLFTIFMAMTLLPRRCPFARLIYSVGDLPARCAVVVNN